MDLPKLLPSSLLIPSSGTTFARCSITQVRGELASNARSAHCERSIWLWCVVISTGATFHHAIGILKISFANFRKPCIAAPPMGKICSISEHVVGAFKRNDIPWRYIWIKHGRVIKHLIHSDLHNRVEKREKLKRILECLDSTTCKNK